MNPKLIILLLIMALGFSGCATTKYQWGDYENALYRHYKRPSEIENMAENLSKIISVGEIQGKVPPGIYAEYGYILNALGKPREAVIYFKKEKDTWPEARIFMDKMINLTEIDVSTKTERGIKLKPKEGSTP